MLLGKDRASFLCFFRRGIDLVRLEGGHDGRQMIKSGLFRVHCRGQECLEDVAYEERSEEHTSELQSPC